MVYSDRSGQTIGSGSDSAIVTAGADILGTLRGVFGDYLGYRALDKKIDAELARPYWVNDPAGNQYMLGPGNTLIARGQSAFGTAAASPLVQQILIIALLAGGALLAYRALR